MSDEVLIKNVSNTPTGPEIYGASKIGDYAFVDILSQEKIIIKHSVYLETLY